MTYHKLLKYREVKDPEMTSPHYSTVLDCLSPHLTRFRDAQAPLGDCCCVEALPSSQMHDQQPLQEKAKRACPPSHILPGFFFIQLWMVPVRTERRGFLLQRFSLGNLFPSPHSSTHRNPSWDDNWVLHLPGKVSFTHLVGLRRLPLGLLLFLLLSKEDNLSWKIAQKCYYQLFPLLLGKPFPQLLLKDRRDFTKCLTCGNFLLCHP